MIPKSSRRFSEKIRLHAKMRVFRLIILAFAFAALVASGAFVPNINSKKVETQGRWTE